MICFSFCQFLVLAVLVAAANAGFLGAPAIGYAAAPAISYAAPAAVATPAITSQHSNILRSYGNLGQVSTYSKTIDTPFSSVRKSDVRVSNDALAYPAAHAIAAAPVAYHAAPVAAAAPSLLGVAYSAAPAVAHISYSNAYGINYAY
jgi:hypothetical protein